MENKHKGLKIEQTEDHYEVRGSAEDAIESFNKIMEVEDINEALSWLTEKHMNVHEIICAISIIHECADDCENIEIERALHNLADAVETRMDLLITLMPIHAMMLDSEDREKIAGVMQCWEYREVDNSEKMEITISLN